jgi:serine/threonine protein kinase
MPFLPYKFLLDERNLKLVDFGVARVFCLQDKKNLQHTIKQRMYTDTGTIFYQAPEMHDNNGYGKKVDLWAVGIVVYEMLTGMKPFNC